MTIDFLSIASASNDNLLDTISQENKSIIDEKIAPKGHIWSAIKAQIETLKTFPSSELEEISTAHQYLYTDELGFPKIVYFTQATKKSGDVKPQHYKINIIDSDGSEYESKIYIKKNELKNLPKEIKRLCFMHRVVNPRLSQDISFMAAAITSSFSEAELALMRESSDAGDTALAKAVHQKTAFFQKFNFHAFGNIHENISITKRNGFIYFADSENDNYLEIDLEKSKKSESEIIATLVFALTVNPHIFSTDKYKSLIVDIPYQDLTNDPFNMPKFCILDKKDTNPIGKLKKNIYSLAFNRVKKTVSDTELAQFTYNFRLNAIKKYLEEIKHPFVITSFDKARLDLILSQLSSLILKNPNVFKEPKTQQTVLEDIQSRISKLTLQPTPKELPPLIHQKITPDDLPTKEPIDVAKNLKKPEFQLQIRSDQIQDLVPFRAPGIEGRYNVYNKGTGYIDFYNLKTIILRKLNENCIDSDEIETMTHSLAKLLTNYSDVGFNIPNQQAQFLVICLHHMRIQSLMNTTCTPGQEKLKQVVLAESRNAIHKSISCFMDDRYNSFLTPQERDIFADLLRQYPKTVSNDFSYDQATINIISAIDTTMVYEKYDFKEALTPYMEDHHKGTDRFEKTATDPHVIATYKKTFYVHTQLPGALQKCITRFNIFCSVPQKKSKFGAVNEFISPRSLTTHWQDPPRLTSNTRSFNSNERMFPGDSFFSAIEPHTPSEQEEKYFILYDALCFDLNLQSPGEENIAFLRKPRKELIEETETASLPLLRNLRVIANQPDGKVRFASMVDYIKNNPAILENELAKPAILNALFYNKDVLDRSRENEALRAQLSKELETLKKRTRPGEYNPGSGFLNILSVLSETTIDKARYEQEFFGEFLAFTKSLQIKKDAFIEENKKNNVKDQRGPNDGLLKDQRNELSSEYKNAAEMAISGMILAKNKKDDVLFLCCHELFLRCRNKCTNKDDSLFHFNADLQKYFFERAFDLTVDKEAAKKLQVIFGGFLSEDDPLTCIKKMPNSEQVSCTTQSRKTTNLFLFTQQMEKEGLFQDMNVDTRAIAQWLPDPLKNYYLNSSEANSYLIKNDNENWMNPVFLMNIHGQEYRIKRTAIRNPNKEDENRLFLVTWQTQTHINGKPFYLFDFEKEYKDFDFILPKHIVGQYDCWASLEDKSTLIFASKEAPVKPVYVYDMAEKSWKTMNGKKVINLCEHPDLLEMERVFGPGIAIETSPGTYELLLKNSPDKKFIFIEKNKTIAYDNVIYDLQNKNRDIPFLHLLSCDKKHVLMANSDQVFHYRFNAQKGLSSFEIPDNLFHAFCCSDNFLYQDCFRALEDLHKNSTTYLEITPHNEQSLLKIMADWDLSVKKFENPTSIALFLKALAAFSVNKKIPEKMTEYINDCFELYNALENETPISYHLTDSEYNILNQHCGTLGFASRQKEVLHFQLELPENIKSYKKNIIESIIGLIAPETAKYLAAIIPVSVETAQTKPDSVITSRHTNRTKDLESFHSQQLAEKI